MKDLANIITELRELAAQANETADALERLQALKTTDLKWTLNVAEAAKVLGVNESTVYEYVRQGEIPSVRLGAKILIPRLALLDWLNGKEVGLRQVS